MPPSTKKIVRFALPDAFPDDWQNRHLLQQTLSDADFGIIDETPQDERNGNSHNGPLLGLLTAGGIDPYGDIADQVLAQLAFADTIPSPDRPNSHADSTSPRPSTSWLFERVSPSPRIPDTGANVLPVFDLPPTPIAESSGKSSPRFTESHPKLPDIEDVDMDNDTNVSTTALDAASHSRPTPPSICNLPNALCYCWTRYIDRVEHCQELNALDHEIHFVHESADAIQEYLESMGVDLEGIYHDGFTDIALFTKQMGLDLGRFTSEIPAAKHDRMFKEGIQQAAAHFFVGSKRQQTLLEFRASLLQLLDMSEDMIM